MELSPANALNVPSRAKAGRDASLAEIALVEEQLSALALAVTERGMRTAQYSPWFVTAESHIETAWRELQFARQSLEEIRL